MTESKIQISFIKAVHSLFQLRFKRYCIDTGDGPQAPIYSCPNEGARTARNGARLKAQGLTAGIPDLFLAIPSGIYSGMYIEVKKPGGKATKKQKAWIDYLNGVGYFAVIHDDAQKAVNSVIHYMELGAERGPR